MRKTNACLIGCFLLVLSIANNAFAQLKTPGQFLPHQLGETFTPHHLLVDYFEYVAANSPNVKLTQYGSTNEKRPLLMAFVSTPENLARLDAIRENNLRRAGLLPGNPDPGLEIAVVWLSYSVHGNEAAGSEASMGVLYDLANTANPETQAWLRNTLVILDPSINPDGYNRYSNWYRQTASLNPNPNPSVREHIEPWPGGRVNHYLFDLNRDWAWQTQVESQQRAVMYLKWMPQIHADLHEQFYNNPYYFAPAAQPYHKFITKFQADFQVEIGKNHAKYFDKNGWLYFTKEVFDLLYPSYGDTYPTFNGAIGMTYEQGGHSRAGRAIEMMNGDTLTLYDRVAHHRATSLSTIEMASKNAARLLQNFSDYFSQSMTSPKGKYKTYVIKGSNPEGRIRALCELLDKNGIRYGKAKTAVNVRGYDYQSGATAGMNIRENDLVISAYQPRSVMTQVLLDPATEVVDSNTYDITAWSLPYAYGLESFATEQKVEVSEGYKFPDYQPGFKAGDMPYAYLGVWESMDNARFLADVLKKGIVVRFATAPLTLEGKPYNRGTLVITRADNRKNPDFDRVVQAAAVANRQGLTAVHTGFSDSGQDLGSGSMELIAEPRIAVLSGKQTSPNEFGQVWYYFEQSLHYPIDIYDADDLGRLDLGDYNILIMPEGRYRLDSSASDKLADWVSGGGRLIAVGDANGALEEKKGFALTAFPTPDDKKLAEKNSEREELDSRLLDFEGQGRRYLSNSLPGAIVKNNVDNTHPLAYGLPDYYFSLKTGTMHYPHLRGAWNVITLGNKWMTSGFIGSKAGENLKNTVSFAVEDKGRGSVVYMIDNPLFRGFWENGKFLFSNALFFR
ncbi:MAG: zinc carboxypeptidase [Lewinella sp.]|nr:zinc carboxypeptidase [Lewinella sp.]